jgi:hypothetical protein
MLLNTLICKMNNIETTVAATTETNIQQVVPTPFFAVSLTKLFLMSLCTFGLYDIFWFYKNWKLVKEQELDYIMPFWRAVFTFFFCYPLFKMVANKAKNLGLGYLPAGPLVVAYIAFILTNYLKEPYSLIANLSIFFLLPIQAAINQINAIKTPGHNPNNQFSAWNIVAILLGGIVHLLVFIGLFFPAQ